MISDDFICDILFFQHLCNDEARLHGWFVAVTKISSSKPLCLLHTKAVLVVLHSYVTWETGLYFTDFHVVEKIVF